MTGRRNAIDLIKLGILMERVRKDKNLTQIEVAEKMGVAKVRVSEMENGRAGFPSIQKIYDWCDAVDVCPATFAVDMLRIANLNMSKEELIDEKDTLVLQ